MEIKQKRTSTINLFFLKYLFGFSVAIIVLAISIVFSFSLAINSGVILPANHDEQEILRVSDTLSKSSDFNKELIPFTTNYALINADGKITESDMSNRTLAKVKDNISNGTKLPQNQFYDIKRTDGSRIIIRYDIVAHFANPQIHKIFPKPELLLLGISVLGTVTIALIVAYKFSKKLKKELSPLTEATKHIQNQELDFDIIPSGISELNDVLNSMESLKNSLSASLTEQWKIEENKRNQISAIAHDIKTPLTIIKGNSELLTESNMDANEKELLKYIEESSNKIGDYIEVLLETSKAVKFDESEFKTFDLEDLVFEIQKEAKALSKIKCIEFISEVSKLPNTFIGDKTLIYRAISNIINNAYEHSKINTRIILKIEAIRSNGLRFKVIDEGEGFKNEELKHATTEFYTKSKARSGKHYGLGLYVAKIVAEKHGGNIIIKNNENSPGASVTLEIYSCN